ncbi:MAG: hypothetical protein DRI56_13825 [Chloroflexota bacterium]|nr:MAG: hypothetical protein DRI56_13825 [Chloroflexota bacterium]
MRIVGKLLRPFAVREFNRALLRETELLKPHLFLAVKGSYVQADTLRAMRQLGAKLYCFYPDVSFMVHGRYLPHALKEYDWIFTTKSFGPKDLKNRLGVEKSSFLPHAFDPEVHQPRPVTAEALETFGCDVSFIGGHSPGKQKVLEELIRRRPDLKLKIWGDRWQNLPKDSPLRPYATFQAIFGIGYATAISCSKINLGLLSEKVFGASSGDKITSRTFHIPASGGLLLHQRTKDLLEIFVEDESCVCFGDIDELVEKIDWLLANEEMRKTIAARGREVVNEFHSWDHRVRTILEHYAGH